MIDSTSISSFFVQHDVELVAGVPDSLLSGLSASFNLQFGPERHVITANEGNAVALAIGHHLSTTKAAVVYLQNSGLGNIVNPITSLAHSDVYCIPMFLIIGWRGEVGVSDEPQHVKQGRSTPDMLETLDIPHRVITADCDITAELEAAWDEMLKTNAPVAVLIGKGVLKSGPPLPSPNIIKSTPSLSREEAIELILDLSDPEDVFVATTGKAGRELFELREQREQQCDDFLTVGGMGYASSIALGVSKALPQARVICLDGDGALLMHMGGLAIIGAESPSNFIHFLLNNESHESVGGQPTVAGQVDFSAVTEGCGYQAYFFADDKVSLMSCWEKAIVTQGPVFIEVSINQSSRKNLGRPKTSPLENKLGFMEKLKVSNQ